MDCSNWGNFQGFAEEVKYTSRFFYSKETNKFLELISSSLTARETIMPQGTELFRSQIGYKWYYEEDARYLGGYEEERMKPLQKSAMEGRANSKGIPVLYLSSDKKTSLAELRPTVGNKISCGTFITTHTLRLVNCNSKTKEYNEFEWVFGEPATFEEWLDRKWFQINNSFSEPVVNTDNSAEYVPTQILSELFRSKGFHGLSCKSHLGPGLNYILFDTSYASMKKCDLQEITVVDYSFEKFDEKKFYEKRICSTTKIKEIEIAIKEAIESTGKNAVERKKRDAANKGTDWKEETWNDSMGTQEILDCLIALAHKELPFKKKYQAAARKDKCTEADCREWLYDLVWYDGSCGKLHDVILSAEIEWATGASTKERLYKIIYDFEKLLIARTEYKVIIFQGKNDFIKEAFEQLETSVRNYERTRSGDRYLFAGWNWDEQKFEFEHLII